MSDIKDGNEMNEPMETVGRTFLFCQDVIHPTTGEVLWLTTDQMINDTMADKIVKAGIHEGENQSVLGCRSKYGNLRQCFVPTWQTASRFRPARRWVSSPPSPSVNRARSLPCVLTSTPAASPETISHRVIPRV